MITHKWQKNKRSQVKTKGLGIPWQSNGRDSALSLLRAWVQSLVRELGSHKPLGMAKKKRKKPKGFWPFISHFNGLEETALNELPVVQVQTLYLKTVTKNLLGISFSH